MSEDKVRYTATPTEGETPGMSTTVWLSFETQTGNKVKASASVGVVTPTAELTDEQLAGIALIGAKSLRIATLIGRRWQWFWFNPEFGPIMPQEKPDDMTAEQFNEQMRVVELAMKITDREEIEGWLVERQP